MAVAETTISGPISTEKPRRGRGPLSALWRYARFALGVLVIVVAVPISWLPGPLGLPIAVVGLVIVLQSSMWAKRRFIRLKRRHPNWVYPLRRLMRRRPEVAPVLWQQALRTERFVFRRRAGLLKRLRRRLGRKRAVVI